MVELQYITDFYDFYEEMSEYFSDHYEGCEEYRSGFEGFYINKDLFQFGIDQGSANLFKVISEDSVAGYVNVSISPSPLFKSPQAVLDLLYILPSFRNKGVTKEVVSQLEEALGEQGVKALNIMLPDKDYSEVVSESLGYEKTSTIYTKEIGE